MLPRSVLRKKAISDLDVIEIVDYKKPILLSFELR
jgi:hypothetical protein